MALPRPQSSRRGWRTAASARRCRSRAPRRRRHPPRYRFHAASADASVSERSSRLGRPRDRFARIAIAPHQQPRRPLRRWRGRASGDGARVRDRAVLAGDGVASKRPTVWKREPRPCRKSVLLRTSSMNNGCSSADSSIVGWMQKRRFGSPNRAPASAPRRQPLPAERATWIARPGGRSGLERLQFRR